MEGPKSVPDTLQWIVHENLALRVRTFSMDHDIHIWRLTPDPGQVNIIELLTENNVKHFGDVIDKQHILTFETLPTIEDANEKLVDAGLDGRFMKLVESYVFWSPDGEEYTTRSNPDEG